jgi:hypothetical protein
MRAKLTSTLAAAAIGLALTAVFTSLLVAQEKTRAGQSLLKVDWADTEIAAFKRAGQPTLEAAGAKPLRLPVLAFGAVPQLVKNVAGPDAKPIKARSIISDPAEPYWYHLVDTYDGITIAVDADLRINHQVDSKFQIGAKKDGAEAALGTKAKPKISILDNASEEGMEGLIIQYTVQKFPDIPYNVTIECSGKAKSQCKDIAVIAKDQALLKLIAASGG